MGEIECDSGGRVAYIKTVFYEVENKPKFNLMKKKRKKKKGTHDY